VLLAYGAQSVAVEEFRPAGGPEQVRFRCLPAAGPCCLCGRQRWLLCVARPRLGGRGRGACTMGSPAQPRLLLATLGLLSCLHAIMTNVAQEIFADDGGRVWDRCSVVAYFPPELDGGAILSSAAADFGLGAAAAAAEVEAVRAQDWEQSIKVWRPWGCAAPLPSWAELRCWRRRQAPSACACGQLLLVSSFFTLVHRRTATSLLRWGRGCGSFPSGASRPTRQPPTYCWSRVRRRAGPAVPKLCCCSGGACAWLACWLRLLALLAGADATLPPVAML
jgi:hypothetical protein